MGKILFGFLFVYFGVYLGAQAYTPSPADWNQQIIYFLMTDRFADGDPTNNDMGAGEYKPGDMEFYHGGDLKGLTARLDYIKALGATALWISPQVKNQWMSPAYGRTRYSGYHGYWAQDFYAVDPHLGTMEDYKNFVKEAHARGLYVIQDIVPNHMGDFYQEDGAPYPVPGIAPAPAAPFDDPAKVAEYFHLKGTDIYTKGFAGLLDDLNTENPYVIEKLIDIFKFWIREADLDGYRIDTAKYIPMAFWEKFIPEIRAYAASLGKKDFIIFGEAYDYDNVIAFKFTDADRTQAKYTGTAANPLYNSMLDFAVSGALTKVFASSPVNGESSPSRRIRGSFSMINERFTSEVMDLYTEESRGRRVTFLDNHDMLRFLHVHKAQEKVPVLKQALAALYTLPGIPQLYYGTEQGFNQPKGIKNGKPGLDNRQDLWTTGYKTDGDLFQYIARLSQIRRENPAVYKGSFIPVITDGAEGDLWAFTREHQGQEVLVVMNRGEKTRNADLSSRIPQGAVDLLSGKTFGTPGFFGGGGKIDIPPQGVMIFRVK